MIGLAVRVMTAVALCAGVAHAQAEPASSTQLRAGNAAALAGDWLRVSQLVEPLLEQPLAQSDLAEAHRLAGLAAFFHRRSAAAEHHFVAYLRVAPTGRLDPALYPPDVVTFFNDVASRHAAELAPPRAPPARSWWLTLVPPLGQWQNRQPAKAYVLGGVLGALLVTNLTTYYFLRTWCQTTDGPRGGGLSCYNGDDHNHDAARLRPTNIATGVGFLVVYAYGVIDGLWGYRQRSNERAARPFVDASTRSSVIGVIGRF